MLSDEDRKRIGPGAVLLWEGRNLVVVTSPVTRGGFVDGWWIGIKDGHELGSVNTSGAWNLDGQRAVLELLRPSPSQVEPVMLQPLLATELRKDGLI